MSPSLLSVRGGSANHPAEHLGLLHHQEAFDRSTQPNAAMHPAPVPHEYDFGSEEDLAVQDPLSDAFQQTWFETGRRNKDAFQKIFMPVPNDEIRNWKQYSEYLKPHAGIPVSHAYHGLIHRTHGREGLMYQTGHVVNKNLSLQQVKQELMKVRGHLVDMPLNFLIVSRSCLLPRAQGP